MFRIGSSSSAAMCSGVQLGEVDNTVKTRRRSHFSCEKKMSSDSRSKVAATNDFVRAPTYSLRAGNVRRGGRMRVRVFAGLVTLFAAWIWIDGRAQSGGPVVSGADRVEKVTDGTHYAGASGTMNVGANAPVLLPADEALVIDSEITPAAGRALAADLKAVSSKPIRYVVDSHYHYDHSHGNQVFMQ